MWTRNRRTTGPPAAGLLGTDPPRACRGPTRRRAGSPAAAARRGSRRSARARAVGRGAHARRRPGDPVVSAVPPRRPSRTARPAELRPGARSPIRSSVAHSRSAADHAHAPREPTPRARAHCPAARGSVRRAGCRRAAWIVRSDRAHSSYARTEELVQVRHFWIGYLEPGNKIQYSLPGASVGPTRPDYKGQRLFRTTSVSPSRPGLYLTGRDGESDDPERGRKSLARCLHPPVMPAWLGSDSTPCCTGRHAMRRLGEQSVFGPFGALGLRPRAVR